MKRPLLLGHRGSRGCGFIENSLAAFEYALSEGCDGVEFDVRQTRDGHNVIWHDPDYHGNQIAETNYPELIDQGGNRPSTLEEVLLQFGNRAYLDIELKTSGSEETIVGALKSHEPQAGFIITSFYPDILQRVHELDSGLPLGFLCERQEHVGAWRDLPIRASLPRCDLIDKRLVEAVHDGGRQIMAWTVNSSRQIRRLADWGIDGVISDDPRLLYQTFHNA